MRGSIKKRGTNSWRLTFDLERDHTGKRRQKTLTVRGTKKEAEAELSRKLAEIESGGFADPGNIKLAEYLARWLEHVETKTAAKTHERHPDRKCERSRALHPCAFGRDDWHEAR